MTAGVLTTIAVTGFTVAFVHAAIPTHWLPFVLTARVQKWSRSRTLLITTFAALGHVLFTAVLGFFVAWGGIALNDKIDKAFPWIAGGALLLFGFYYVVRQVQGERHGHTRLFGAHARHHHVVRDHSHTHGHTHMHTHEALEKMEPPPPRSDWMAIVSLFALLTFSPCEGFIPIYVSGVRYGWPGFFLLTAILSIATVAGMIVFTSLALAGLEKLELKFVARYESGVLGGLLMLLGALIILFER